MSALGATLLGKVVKEIDLAEVEVKTEIGAVITLVTVSRLVVANADGSQVTTVPFVLPSFTGPDTATSLKKPAAPGPLWLDEPKTFYRMNLNGGETV